MDRFFEHLPFNTSKTFVGAHTYNGCLVIVPCHSSVHENVMAESLVKVLAQQPNEPGPPYDDHEPGVA